MGLPRYFGTAQSLITDFSVANTDDEQVSLNPRDGAVIQRTRPDGGGGGGMLPAAVSPVLTVRSKQFKRHWIALGSLIPTYTRLTFFGDL